MGKFLLVNLHKVKFEIWRITFLKSFFFFLPLKNYWMDFRFSGK